MQTSHLNRDRRTKIIRIRQLNDALRQTFTDGRLVITQGVAALSPPDRTKLFGQIQAFTDFELGGDPYGEHDFGSVYQSAEQFFWKIDYYNLDLSGGSEDPSDHSRTTRVLTIMQAQEY